MAVRKTTKKTTDKKVCNSCKRELAINNFYQSSSIMFADKKTPICKSCLKSMVDYNDMNTIYTILQSIDIPFIKDLWASCENKKEEKDKEGKTYDILGNYIRQIQSLTQYKTMGWKNSNFEKAEDIVPIEKKKNNTSQEELDFLSEKWGYGYKVDELKAFERKYKFLKNNYPEKTNMHIEALQNYVRYQVKAEFAVAEGDVSGAKAWGDLANKQATNAKINPSQLSKADLSGGLSGFGELVRAVEQAVDIIPVLPKFKEKPQDKVDFTLWCYINYIRRLKGMPDADYKDIYRFYEERKEEYKRKDEEKEFEFEDET